MKILADLYSYLKRLYARHFGFSLVDLRLTNNRTNDIPGLPNTRGQLYKRWNIFFAALITFWIIVMFVFCVSILTQSKDYTTVNRRRIHIENEQMNNPYFGVFYKIKKDIVDLEHGGNPTDDLVLGPNEQDKVHGIESVGLDEPLIKSKDRKLEDLFFGSQGSDRRRNVAIEDLPRDEISKEIISIEKEISIIDEVPQNKTLQNNDVSVLGRLIDMSITDKVELQNNGTVQNISNHDKTSQINSSNVDELSRQNKSLNLQEKTSPAVKGFSPEGYFANLLRTHQEPQNKEVLEAFEAYKDFHTQKNNNYVESPMNGAQQNPEGGYQELPARTQSPSEHILKNALSPSNNYLNVKHPPDLFFRQQNGDTYLRRSSGIQSQNRPVLNNALHGESFQNQLVQRQNDVLDNDKKQELSQQQQQLWVGHKPVNLPVGNQRKSDNVYSKQGVKTQAPVGFRARIMPKYNAYQRQQLQQQQKQQQPINPSFKSLLLQKLMSGRYNKPLQNPQAPIGSQRGAYVARNVAQDNANQPQRRKVYGRLAVKTGPKYRPLLRNPVVNNQAPKQSGHLYPRKNLARVGLFKNSNGNIPINSGNQQQIQNSYGRRADPRYQPLIRNQVNNNQLNNNQVQNQNGGGRSNIFSLNRPQKQLVHGSFNRKPVDSNIGNANNVPNINFKQPISDNINNNGAAAKVEPRNQAVSNGERVSGSFNKAAGEQVKLNRDRNAYNNQNLNSEQRIGDQNNIRRTSQQGSQNKAVFGRGRAGEDSVKQESGQNRIDGLSEDVNEQKTVVEDSAQVEPQNQANLESGQADHSSNRADGKLIDKLAEMDNAGLKALYERFLAERNALKKSPTDSEQRKVQVEWPSESEVEQNVDNPINTFDDF